MPRGGHEQSACSPFPWPARLVVSCAIPLLLLAFVTPAAAECVTRLPVANSTIRIVAGLQARPTDIDNVVTIASTTDEGEDYFCVGSLISPEWVITAAQCFIRPFVHFVYHGGSTSLSGQRYEILAFFTPPDYASSDQQPRRSDIQLVQLSLPVEDSFVASPSPSPPSSSQSAPTSENPDPGRDPAPDSATAPLPADSDTPPASGDAPFQPPSRPVAVAVRQNGNAPPGAGAGPVDVGTGPTDAEISGTTSQQFPPINRGFNFMRINNNSNFAMDQPRYLRLKGFGITAQPKDTEEPLRFKGRELKFADLPTSACDDSFGNDGKRRLCTRQDASCGACYGDTGAPLFDVDKSGRVTVLVGIVTFGVFSTEYDNPVCTGERPVVYTAVGMYAKWIRDTIVEETGEERVLFFDLPKEGITRTLLATESSPLAIFARTSVIVISSLAVLGALVALIITCVLRHLRKKRRRWVEGLQAEDSFVKAGEKDAIIVDPFEGIQSDQNPRFSFTTFSRAAVKGATEFSSKSIDVFRALVTKEKEEDFFERREAIQGAPEWVSSAWDTLFVPPSKKDMRHIHKIPTQRVVDDVLEGGDKSVEPSLEEVAFKNAREEANLEAAWAKLEAQTSLRNLSEASGSTANILSPTLGSPSVIRLPSSPRKGSRSSSRLRSPMGSSTGKPGDFTKADTLLAAFASIDADAERVAEETTIDSGALQALAQAKKPKVLEALRRKFSAGGNNRSMRSSHRESDGEQVRAAGSAAGMRLELGSLLDATSPAVVPGLSAHLPNARSSRIVTGMSSNSGYMAKSSLGSRQSSMMMDFFSENYSISSGSSDDEDRVSFENTFDTKNRRYTEDRKLDSEQEGLSIRRMRSRSSQKRSFESLERKDSRENLPDGQGMAGYDEITAAPDREERQGGQRRVDRAREALGNQRNQAKTETSTSTVSSEKRPRSAEGPRGMIGLRGRTSADQGSSSTAASQSMASQYTAPRLAGATTTVSVHMEDGAPLEKQGGLPDRAEYIQSNRSPWQEHGTSDVSAGGSTRENLESTGDDSLSVHMEDGDAGKDGTRGGTQRVVQRMVTDSGDDRVSVRMEEDLPVPNAKQIKTASVTVGFTGTGVTRESGNDAEQLSVHMEEEEKKKKEGNLGNATKRAHRTLGQILTKGKAKPNAKMEAEADMNAVSVEMEDEGRRVPSVRSRILSFDQSGGGTRPVRRESDASAESSNVSVAKLKHMWNEIARRSSEEGAYEQ